MNSWPPSPSGQSNHAQWCKSIEQLIRERTLLNGVDDGVSKTVTGYWLPFPKGGKGGGSTLQRMIIKGIGSDWFYCLAYSSAGQSPAGTPDWQEGITPISDYILVAKPWELRWSPWDGQTVDGIHFNYAGEELNYARRKATAGAVVEIHIVVRPWYIGEIILATKNITGGTDQQDDGPQGDGTPPLADLIWEDTNQAAHAWAQTDIPDPGDAAL